MRVDLIITELDTGGAERCCAALAKYLHRKGDRVRLIALGPAPPIDRNELVEMLAEYPIEICFLGASTAWRLPSTLGKLRQLVRADPPDVVQSFLWHANVLAAAVYPSFRVPVVGGNRVSEPRRSRYWIGRWAGSRMRRIVCVSRSVAQWTIRTERVPESKLVVIPNGVELRQRDVQPLRGSAIALAPQHVQMRTDAGVPVDVPVLLFVGRLEPQKGIDILRARWNELLKRCEQHHLVIIGNGSLREHLLRWRMASPYATRIHWLGYRRDVRDWMQMSDLLLLPTRYEGMANVVLEGMAEGLAIATTNVDGTDEILGKELSMQAVERDDWDGWTELVVSMASDPIRSLAIGLRNWERVSQHFQLEMQLAAYRRLLESVAGKSDSAGGR